MKYFITCLFLCLFTFTVYADDWRSAYPRIFASMSGENAIKIVPIDNNIAVGTLLYLNADGNEVEIYKVDLINIPLHCYVTDFDSFVTVGTWYTRYGDHFLVVYDLQGKVIGDYKPDDILTANEINSFIDLGVTNKMWHKDLVFRSDYIRTKKGYVHVLRITFHWGREVIVDIKTGQIIQGK